MLKLLICWYRSSKFFGIGAPNVFDIEAPNSQYGSADVFGMESLFFYMEYEIRFKPVALKIIFNRFSPTFGRNYGLAICHMF